MTRPLAINCYSFIWKMDAAATVAHLADAGYRSFELMVNAPHLWPSAMGPAARGRMKQLLDDRDLSILSLAPPMLDLNLVSPSPEMRRYTRDHYRDVIRLAGEWEAPYVVVVAGKTHPLLTLPDATRDIWFQDAMEEMLASAKLEGVRLLLENVPASFLPTARDVSAAVERFGGEMGVCYDVANAHFIGEDPAEAIGLFGRELELVHLSDTSADKWEHTVVGTRSVPFDRIARKLEDIDYRGETSLEIIAADPDEQIGRSVEYLAALGWRTR